MSNPARRAFSLLEMLVVIAILAFLSALLLPAISSVMRGNQLTRGADKLVAVMSLARQKALAKNHPVEARFYQYADPEVPGETSLASGKYRAVQAFEIDDTGRATPIGKVEVMPTSVILDSGATLSTLVGLLTNSKTWTTNDPQVSIPRAGTNYNCRAFRFSPEGSASLSKTGLWFVTLHSILEGDSMATPPANYISVQIDPANGSLKTWQP